MANKTLANLAVFTTVSTLLASVGSITPAAAAILSFDLSGTFEDGSTFSGTIEYDPLTPLGSVFGAVPGYEPSQTCCGSIDVLGTVIRPSILLNNSFVNEFTLLGFPRGTAVLGLTFQVPELNGGFSLPTSFASASFLSGNYQSIIRPFPPGLAIISAQITPSVSSVPVPESDLVTGLSLLGMGFLLRKKTASSQKG
jgi:hypothetical protein